MLIKETSIVSIQVPLVQTTLYYYNLFKKQVPGGGFDHDVGFSCVPMSLVHEHGSIA